MAVKRKKLSWTRLALYVAAIGMGLYLSLPPWRAAREEQQKAAAAAADMRSAERQRAQLEAERAQVEAPIGREELARKRGYRKAGEQPLEGF